MPSLWEGFPISILEAGASALPVLSTPVGSIPSFLTEECGYLSEIEAFPEKMVEIMADYNKAKIKGEELRKKIQENFSIESVVLKHEKLYKSLLP